MAKDDINVIVYKILRYLYECKKAGIRIGRDKAQHEY